MTQSAPLNSRALLRISGSEAISFLQNLVTCEVEGLAQGDATFGALLTPQGKILFDFFLVRDADGFIVDVSATQKDALAKRLTFYKLRADVVIAAIEDLNVYALWGDDLKEGFSDPRLPALGNRLFESGFQTNSSEKDWEEHRIGLGVPESETDFDLGDAFPHEVLMDQFTDSGVDFSKGCYVGQEVVSRMHHRGTARSRWVKAHSDKPLPEKGTLVQADDRKMGSLGGSTNNNGLAVVRLDRAKVAIDGGTAIVADNAVLQLEIPSFVNFGWPE